MNLASEMMVGRKHHIIHGLRDGIPIAMGYFAVTFSLGIIAARAGLTAPEGFLSSFFTRASAGEYGTYTLVAAQAAYVEVIAMCLVANLIRVTPMVLIRGELHNRFVRSFLYYVPYVTLAVMTFPDMIMVTPTPLPGIIALLAGIVAAWFRLGLFPVAAICCVIVYLLI